jgi:trimeric autotransporter adhesin
MLQGKNLFFIFILFFCSTAHSQVITTFAGNNTRGLSGDGGGAVSAELSYPEGIAVDGAGNLYIADWGNNCIRKVSAAGVITTIAGNGSMIHSGDGGQAISAGVANPQSIAVDNAGNLYISEGNSDRKMKGNFLDDSLIFTGSWIRKVNAAGIITTIAGNGKPGYCGDGGPATSAQFNLGADIAIDRAGNLYIADYGNMRIRKVNTAGVITTIAGIGTAGYGGDSMQATKAQLYYPYGIAVDNTGDLYIADSYNNRIRKVSADGLITTVAGNGKAIIIGDSVQAINAELHLPQGIAVDNKGNVYFTDQANTGIKRVNAAGMITAIPVNSMPGGMNNGGAVKSPELINPGGLAVDGTGNVYFTDDGNNVIRKVSIK